MAKYFPLVIMIIGGLMLAGCAGKGEQPEGQDNGGGVSSDKVNQYLTTQGIALPSGAERADLTGAEGVGVATREKKDGVTTYTIRADLPDLTQGSYQGWLRKADGTAKQLGQLIFNKGGYILEASTQEDWSEYKQVGISGEMGVVLEGSF